MSCTAPTEDGSQSFTGTAEGFADSSWTNGVSFATEPLERDIVMAGVPTMELVASATAPRVHLIANLLDEGPNEEGEPQRRRLSQFAINPELQRDRDGHPGRSG